MIIFLSILGMIGMIFIFSVGAYFLSDMRPSGEEYGIIPFKAIKNSYEINPSGWRITPMGIYREIKVCKYSYYDKRVWLSYPDYLKFLFWLNKKKRKQRNEIRLGVSTTVINELEKELNEYKEKLNDT